MAREINLVPDVKDEMIKALKLRNLIFFICIVVASASVGVTLLFGMILGGQQLALEGKKTMLTTLSDKLNSYSDLGDFLTIKDQLGNLSSISDNKQVLSRTFNILSAMVPTGADTITISELTVNLSEENPIYTFDAQANAGREPFIDYNVLDSFKKSMQYLRYDFGSYVDKDGNTIPAYCIIETGSDGAIFRDPTNGIYAFWTIDGEGCNPAKPASTQDDDATIVPYSDNYSRETYEGQTVVRIWRTPQFSSWYKETLQTGQPTMTIDGAISNVPHFESQCIKYSGDTSRSSSNPKWIETNESCLLVPAGTEGINITESSNGRGASDELVLRFSASITLSPEVYKFSNTHVLAIAPAGRYNVTDSYVQIQAMFGERAADCEEGDTACSSNKTNEGGN